MSTRENIRLIARTPFNAAVIDAEPTPSSHVNTLPNVS